MLTTQTHGAWMQIQHYMIVLHTAPYKGLVLLCRYPISSPAQTSCVRIGGSHMCLSMWNVMVNSWIITKTVAPTSGRHIWCRATGSSLHQLLFSTHLDSVWRPTFILHTLRLSVEKKELSVASWHTTCTRCVQLKR